MERGQSWRHPDASREGAHHIHCFTISHHKILHQMFFSVEDVVKNFRHFMESVKRATGNEKDTESDTKKGKGTKTGKFSSSSF